MKSGQRGISRTREEIAQFKAAWAASGKSKKEFAIQNDINYMTFISWFGKKVDKKEQEPSFFIPIPVNKLAALPFAEVILKNGSRVCFYERIGADYFSLLLK